MSLTFLFYTCGFSYLIREIIIGQMAGYLL
jgi:hypothetical protein